MSFAVITALFALMYKFVPDIQIEWRDVWIGAIGTALLFTIGKFLLPVSWDGEPGSAYGAAGSLVAVIAWFYYSAQIFFFGAELFTCMQNSTASCRSPKCRA